MDRNDVMDGERILSSLGLEPKNGKSQVPQPSANGTKPPAAEELGCFYDHARKGFWAKDHHGEWVEFTETQFKRLLRSRGLSSEIWPTPMLNQLEDKLLELQHSQSCHFAGEVAGWLPGLHTICGQRILVTKGPVIPAPKEKPWPTLKKLIAELLGDEQKHFHAWMQSALLSLKAGSPFRPGQLLAIAGPAGCGKSLLQGLVTELLGGRSAKPYAFLVGDSNFNAHLFRAEHLMIEDEPASIDMRARRHLAAAVKGLCVNTTQQFHRKGKEPIPMEPFWRLTITLNDDQDHLMVLPPMDDSLLDKVILLRARPASFPFDSDQLDARKLYRATLSAELPGYLFWLKRWRMPAELKDQRYGCKAYQNDALLKGLQDLDPEHKLWTLIQALGVVEPGQAWEGTAAKLELVLREKDRSGDISRILYYNTACGGYLAKLAKRYPANFQQLRHTKGLMRWRISADDELPDVELPD